MVAQGIPQPLHIGPLAAQVNEIRRRFRGAIEPGDAFIVNHPYQACQNHATDVTVISPMFAGERLVGFIGNIAHKPDLGGKVPGTNSGDATDLFQEGLLIPPLKILRRGEINADVRGDHLRQHPHAGGDLGRHQGAGQHQHLRPEQIRGAVRQIRRRYRARLLAALDGHLREPSCARKSPRCPTASTARRPTISTTTASTSPSRIASRRRCEVEGDTLHFILDSDAQARGPDQPAALRVAQLHRVPGEDDLHPGACR